jgi:hypothetical protein
MKEELSIGSLYIATKRQCNKIFSFCHQKTSNSRAPKSERFSHISIIHYIIQYILEHLTTSQLKKWREEERNTAPPLPPSLSSFLVQMFSDDITEPVFVDLLRSPGIDSQPGRPVRQPPVPAHQAT